MDVASTMPARLIGDLTTAEVSGLIHDTSILCLPLGSFEQHGPHLPLDTDVVVAECVTRRIVARWGDEFDLWQLPTVPIGLSREHDWAPGTLSLPLVGFVTLLRDLARDIVRALPARRMAIINGHGGNRGVLENLLHELYGDFGLCACVIHPFDLARAPSTAAAPDVHGGRNETSIMLALAPDRVRMGLIEPPREPPDQDAMQALVYDRGVTWAWRSDDARLAHNGIIGDASGATAAHGEAILDRIVAEAGGVFGRLSEVRRDAKPR
jgi:creatinine amidohydrolase